VVTACSADYSPAVRITGKMIVSCLSSQCAPGALLARSCGLACASGVTLGTAGGKLVRCERDCLADADCVAEQVWPTAAARPPEPVARCPAFLFDDPTRARCGSTCPCWRLVPSSRCSPSVDGSPYAFDVLRDGPAPKRSIIRLTCATSVERPGSAALLSLPRCGGSP